MSYEETRILRDQAARDAIVNELHRNVTVLAGAGAGKTHALIERMAALIRGGRATVDRIAAITFTRKAAGEMRGRFHLRLAEAKKNTSGDELVRVESALQNIDQCFIGTIHAFCGRLLRERPIEAGLPPDFSEIEQRDEARLRREAWDAFVQECIAEEDARLEELDEHGIEPEDLYAFFGRRCGYVDLPLKETLTPKPDLRPSVAEVRRFVNDAVGRIPPHPEKRDQLMSVLLRARRFISNHGLSQDCDRAELLCMFDRNLSITQKNWGEAKDFAKYLKHEGLPQIRQQVVEPALKAWRECAYRVVADFVDEAVAHYDRLRQERGKVTFQDLLARTESVLRENSDVRTYFQRRFEAILVDEFQDTDPIQARILMYLAGTDVHERDWLKLSPRPGSLFLVGDDKQSIYRFRRADVETFQEVRTRIEETGGKVLQLNTSFRSLGNLCEWLSSSFPAIFAVMESPYQADFAPLFQYRSAGADPHCVRRITIPYVKGHKRDKIIEADAQRIAGFIAAAVSGETPINQDGDDALLPPKASPGDFMILTRTSTRISAYARALEACGIPFDVVGGARLGESAELKTLLNLLTTVFRPNDPVPYLSYLRGPLVGLADDELYELRQAGGCFDYRAPLPDRLSDDLYERMQSARELVRKAEQLLMASPPASAIEQILEESGLLGYAAVHPDGQSSSRAGNLLRVLSLVRQHVASGRHWGEVVEDLIDLVEDPEYNVEEMTLETGRDDVVRIMNLHQAKGLQAKVVFLADPYDTSPSRHSVDVHVSRSKEKPYFAASVVKPIGEHGKEVVAQPVGWETDQEEEERFQAAEEARLLYVAATRARNLLVVSRYAGKSDKGPWAPLYGYLDEVPELDDCGLSEVASDPIAPVDLESRRTAQQDRRMLSARPSYVTKTVSGATDDEKLELIGRDGRGRSYGVLVHRLFEEAVCGTLPENEREYIHLLVAEADLPEDTAPAAYGALTAFRNSAVWNELQEADEVYTEVPLGSSSGSQDEPEIVRGVIDLVFRRGDEWKIVDYKTDAAATPAELAALERRYEPQVQAYSRYWEAITGARVSSSRVWFVHGPDSGTLTKPV